jgi:capsular exopolysaccharide synthesis family protein
LSSANVGIALGGPGFAGSSPAGAGALGEAAIAVQASERKRRVCLSESAVRRSKPARIERISLSPRADSRDADWLQPPEEQEGLQRYVETIRERFWLIVATVAVTTGIALLYVATATKTYEAEADLLVTPVTSDDTVLVSLGLIRESADPTRDVETASRLITNVDVAERVKEEIGSPLAPQDLLEEVTAEPVAQSNIVAVTATANSPEGARELANAFAQGAVADKTQEFHAQIERQLPVLRAQVEAGGDPTLGDTPIASTIAQLQLLRSGPTPDMRVETLAPLPTTQASPRPALSIAAGIVAGLILGIAAAFGSQVLDPRLRREAQLRRLYRLPILGRIPKEASKIDKQPLAPGRVSPVTAEAYRTLRATLTGPSRGSKGRVILITGSSPSEGKTTTAVNLAASLALAGKRVILIESDLRRPVLGDVLGARPDRGGVVSVLIENTTLAQALTLTSSYGPNLQVLLADYEGGWIAELFSIPTAERMIDDAREMADYVIIDSPPLNEVVDALPLAMRSDDVLIVARLGVTRLDKLSQLGELLAESGVRPAGFAVIGTPRPARGEYHYYAGVSVESADGRTQRQLLKPREGSR